MIKHYLWLNQHIYCTFFGDQAILLDLKKDQYHILSLNFSKLMKALLKGDIFIVNKDFYSHALEPLDKIKIELETFVSHMIKDKILSSKKYISPYGFSIHEQAQTRGIVNVDWRLPLEGIDLAISKREIFEALYILIKVRILMKIKGFNKTIGLIKKLKRKIHPHLNKQPSETEINTLLNALNMASLIWPSLTKCLEWSISFVLLALKRGWQCNLAIGVQTYPFVAHAWAELNGKIIGDSKDIPNSLAVILREPFREIIT